MFILGAGASREAGGPLMSDFLDIAEGLIKSNETGGAADAFELVFRAKSALQIVHSKSTLDLDNIESLFAAFEMANLFMRPLGPLKIEEVEGLPTAMRHLIVQTLQRRILFQSNGEQVLPPTPYPGFVNFIDQLLQRHDNEVSVITFNYDLALDYAFHFFPMAIDYCLGVGLRAGALHFMKLHGSLNWTRCSKSECNAILAWYLDEYFSHHPWGRVKKGVVRFDLADRIQSSLIHCNKPRSPDPVIVPPTWNKTQYHKEIENVWRRAAQHLSEAENIFVIGYSLPETDQFFRYLFALGTMSDRFVKNFWVFDPHTEPLKARFSQLLGPMTKRRFQCIEATFANAVGYIQRNAQLT